MSESLYIKLENRGLIRIQGEDAKEFLQGLISNDTQKLQPETPLYATFLTPQGKFLHDFFLLETSEGLLLDCEASRLGDLLRRLTMYKLRSKVDLVDCSESFSVYALINSDTSIGYTDPRCDALGQRVVLPVAGADVVLSDAGLEKGEMETYETLRLSLGIPDGSRDMVVEKAILLENGIDELNGIDWDKGCYMGQELTARTRYRGLVKKRLVPVLIDGATPESGQPVTMDGREVGEMRSGLSEKGLALLKLDAFYAALEGNAVLMSGDSILKPEKPDWARFPEQPEQETAGIA